jgi:hypothetical protein
MEVVIIETIKHELQSFTALLMFVVLVFFHKIIAKARKIKVKYYIYHNISQKEDMTIRHNYEMDQTRFTQSSYVKFGLTV